MKGKNQKNLKEENTSVILKLIHENRGISRADIVRLTKLAPPTVSRIVSFLIGNSLTNEEKGETNNIGRKPFSLYFNGDNFYVLSIEISYLYLKFGIVTISGKVIKTETVNTTVNLTENDLKDKLFEIGNTLLNNFKKEKFLGIGISAPGMIDSENGIIISVPNLSHIKRVNIQDTISNYFHLPVLIANDANAEAVGEKYFGEGKNVRDFILLHIGYGVGAGIILDKKLYAGNFGVSGEIGHTSINRNDGKICDCGNKGCVELYVGYKQIIEDCSKATKVKITNLEEVRSLLLEDNKQVSEIIREKGELIGYVLVNAVNLLAPQKIVVTGPVTDLGDYILNPIKKVVEERSFYEIGKKIPIVASKLKNNSGLIGAMTIVLDNFLEKPYTYL
jgi:predicted NBD/HSP70 family sugar kinase